MRIYFAENAFIALNDSEFYKLENPKVGAEFELNDHRGVIVGIAHVASSGLFGVPTLYTTYNRALQYIPSTRSTISYLLVEPKSPADVASIKRQVTAAGYLALTKDEFIQKISNFYKYQTAIGTNMLITGTIMVGWKETSEAARALAAAMPLIKKARKVILVSVHEGSSMKPEMLANLVNSLAWHGIVADKRLIADSRERAPGELLLRAAADAGADLLVVGGYGHRPLREAAFGGVTAALIRQAKCPIFMTH